MVFSCPDVQRHHNDYVRIGGRLRVMDLAVRWRAGFTKLIHRATDADCGVYIYIYICIYIYIYIYTDWQKTKRGEG